MSMNFVFAIFMHILINPLLSHFSASRIYKNKNIFTLNVNVLLKYQMPITKLLNPHKPFELEIVHKWDRYYTVSPSSLYIV